MILIDRLIRWYGTRVVYGALALILILLAVGGYFLFGGSGDAPEAEAPAQKRVVVGPAGALESIGAGIRTVGTVRAVSEARLQTESSGRVTAVNVEIGDQVGAGAVLASLESASERAVLLQAEGTYDSALVARSQAGAGLDEARIAAQNTFRTSFTVSDDAVHNLADDLFSSPDSQNPGLRINGEGRAVELGIERKVLEAMLDAWGAKIQNGIADEDPRDLLDDAERDLRRTSNFISTLAGLVASEDPNAQFTAEILGAYEASFLAARSRLDAALQSVSSVRSSLSNAEHAANGGTATESEARIKQALGSLRAAQASYEKTLVRSPISGTVNAVYLRANEYVGMNTPAAVVANNNALEISTSVSEDERDVITIGGSVLVEGQYEGTITHIAPAVDPLTGKIEVRVSVDGTRDGAPSLANGTTATLTLRTENGEDSNGPLLVPMRALKLSATGPVAFSVSEEGTLVAHAVTLGPIRGDMVTIESGITAETPIVADARGLKEGERVEVTAQ